MFWIKQAMPATWKAFEDNKLDKLTVWKEDGILMVTGRDMEGLKHYFGVDYLPVLMSSSRLAKLIIMDAHNADHYAGDRHTGDLDSWGPQVSRRGGPALHQVQVPQKEARGPEYGSTTSKTKCSRSTIHSCGPGSVWTSRC